MGIKPFLLRKQYWIEDFFHGSKMWKSYKDIYYLQREPEGKERRNFYLSEILSFAKANTVFYGKVSGNQLEDFPVIDKKVILDNYNDFLVPLNKIPCQKDEVHIQKTSGSTGIPFQVYQDTRCRMRRIATIKYENEKIGFHSFEPMMHLRAVKHYWGNKFKEPITYDPKLNIVYADNANLTEDRIREIIHAINRYKVKVVRGYMTTLDIITKYAVENNMQFLYHPTFISVGELLLESLRFRLINELNCKIVSQYANEENGVFGQTEVNGGGSTINLNRANCIVEILKLESDEPVGENELGRIVVTDFTNYAMPLIRYDIGDIAMIGKMEDGEISVLKNLSGRKTDLIYTTAGKPIDFFNSVSPDIYNNPDIEQWQFIQESATLYTLKICKKPGSDISDNMLATEIKKIVGDNATIHIEVANQIPVMNSGKRKVVVQKFL